MSDKVCGIAWDNWSRELRQIKRYLDIPEVLLVVLNPRGEVSWFSRKAEMLLGCSEADMLGKKWFETCVVARHRDKAWSEFQKALAGEADPVVLFEYSIAMSSGEERIIAWRRHRILNGDGECVAILGVGEDVTERRRAEDALKKSEALFRGVVETSPDAIAVLDVHGRFLMLGHSTSSGDYYENVEKMRENGISYFDLIAPDSRPLAAEKFKEIAETGKSVICELNLFRNNGVCYPAELHASPQRDSDGRTNSIIVVVRDIADRKRAEEELRQSEMRFRNVSEAAGEYVWETNNDNIYTFVSSRVEKVIGYSPQELLGRHAVDIMVSEDAVCIQKLLCDAATQNKPFSFEFSGIAKDGEVVWIASRGVPRYDANNQLVGFCGASADITERKMAEEELRETRRQAVAANQAKTEFLANISHELRTPMTAILGFTDLLLNHSLSQAEQREFIATIWKNGKSLLDLIDNVLDLSKLETEKATVDYVDCSLMETIDSSVRIAKAIAEEKGLKFSVQRDPSLPNIIHTDPIRLRQILNNLLGNAIKFTERGGIHVAFRRKLRTNGAVHLECSISDTGIGITSEKLAEIFKPFTQADASMSRRHGGSGLGLAISRRLAQMLGGDIIVSSFLGRGSIFTLSVNISASLTPEVASSENAPAAEVAQRSDWTKGHVLLVEDNPDVQNLIRHILQGMKLDADIAANGRIACEAVEQSKIRGWPYDLILMDIQMPEMDGYEATGWLRQHGWKGPIVALTAHAMIEDRQKCLAAGCDEYVAKPVQLKQFREIVAGYVCHGDVPLAPAICSNTSGTPTDAGVTC